MAEGISKATVEKWPQVRLNLRDCFRLRTLWGKCSLLCSLCSCNYEESGGTGFLAEMIGATLIYVIIIRDFCLLYTSNPGRVFILPFFYGGNRSRSIWMEQSSVRRKGNLGQGRNRSPGCKPSLTPLQTGFPLPSYFLALNSLHRKPQSQP